MSLYGIIIGICLAIITNSFTKKNYVVPKNQEFVFVSLLIFSALLGARLYHVLDNWQFYHQNIGQIINTRAGGLGIYGALLGGLTFIFFYSRATELPFIDITDALIPALPLCQAIGRFANFLNQEGYGYPTYSNFGQFIAPNLRPPQYQLYSYFHPVWLYEAILNFLLFLFLKKVKFHQFSYYLIGYGLIRFFTEFFRFDTWQINGLKIAQVISLLFVLIGIISITKNYYISQNANRNNQRPS